MLEKMLNKKVDYFWEFEYIFGEFIKELYNDKYKRKYSLGGNGIYDLLYLNDKIYELKFTQTKTMLTDDSKRTTDSNKNNIIETLIAAFDDKNIEYTVNSGKYITFKIQNNYIAKIEIIKKLKEPI